MSYKIFLSYSTLDFDKVTVLREMLRHPSIKLYVAEYSVSPGEPLAARIMEAIRNCDLFLLLWSTHSKSSDWVPQEIGIAKTHQKTILPIVLEADMRPPGFIADLKYLDASSAPEDALTMLQTDVFKYAAEKERQDGIVWLAIGAATLWLLSK